MAGKNVSEVIYFVSSDTWNLNSINQSYSESNEALNINEFGPSITGTCRSRDWCRLLSRWRASYGEAAGRTGLVVKIALMPAWNLESRCEYYKSTWPIVRHGLPKVDVGPRHCTAVGPQSLICVTCRPLRNAEFLVFLVT